MYDNKMQDFHTIDENIFHLINVILKKLKVAFLKQEVYSFLNVLRNLNKIY